MVDFKEKGAFSYVGRREGDLKVDVNELRWLCSYFEDLIGILEKRLDILDGGDVDTYNVAVKFYHYFFNRYSVLSFLRSEEKFFYDMMVDVEKSRSEGVGLHTRDVRDIYFECKEKRTALEDELDKLRKKTLKHVTSRPSRVEREMERKRGKRNG